MAKQILPRPAKAQATKPVASGISVELFQRMRDVLDCAHLAVDHVDDVLTVASRALRHQDVDSDAAVATCLEIASEGELMRAREQIMEAMDLLQGVSHG